MKIIVKEVSFYSEQMKAFGECLSFGSLFYASWGCKFKMENLSGIYFNRVMFGSGNIFFGSVYFIQPAKYESWFIGKKIK